MKLSLACVAALDWGEDGEGLETSTVLKQILSSG